MGRRMGISLVLGLAIGACPVAGADAAKPHAPAPPAKLGRTAAREAARAQVERFELRNRLITEVSFQGCERRRPDKVACQFYGRGRTDRESGVCSIWVIVTGRGSDAAAELRPECKSEPRLLLSAARALEGIRRAAEELSGRRVEVLEHERRGAAEFVAQVEWVGPAGVVETCRAWFSASLSPDESVVVEHAAPGCGPASMAVAA